MKSDRLRQFPYQNYMKYVVLVLYFTILWFILPIALALFAAYFIYPVVDFIHKRMKLPYLISSAITSLLIFLVFYAFFYISIQSLVAIYPEVKKQITDLQLINPNYLFDFENIINKALSYVDTALLDFANFIQDFFQYLIELFIFIVAFFFSLFEAKKNRLWFFVYVPKPYREEWKKYFSKATSLFGYFIYVEFQLFVITFFLLSCGLALLQFEHPIGKAFLISFADALPFFGIGLFLIPMAIYFFAVGNKFFSFALLLLYLFIQITRQLTESVLWASTFQLRTVHTFLISAASILLFGIYGILLSPFFLLIVVKLKQKSISG